MDVDFTDHRSGAPVDEMELLFAPLRRVCAELPEARFTWFVRIDAGMAEIHGRPDWAFERHAGALDWLRAAGHEIAWHHHAYRRGRARRWLPEVRPDRVVEQLRAASDVAHANGLRSTRMGWGFQANETVAVLPALGWPVDSSAIPRPRYSWSVGADWVPTPQHPYRPSRADYRVPGTPSHDLLEIPITTVPLGVPTDTVPDVRRYVDPAYHAKVFDCALARLGDTDPVVLVCHPYETAAASEPHPLLAFDPDVFRRNLEVLLARFGPTATVAEAAACYETWLPA